MKIQKAKRISYKNICSINHMGTKISRVNYGKPTYDIIIDDKSFDFKKD